MRFFKRTDILVIAVLIVISVGALIGYKQHFSATPAKAEIYYMNELVETVDLSQGTDKTFFIPQKPHVVFHLTKDGTIRFEQSDCPDQVCVHAGKLDTVGQYAACLPNDIMMKIVASDGAGNEDADIVAY